MIKGAEPLTVLYQLGVFTSIALMSACGSQRFGSEPNDTNQVVWVAPGEVTGLPASDGQTVYYGTSNHLLTAVDAGTGVVRWQSQTQTTTAKTTNGANVLLVGDNVVFGDYSIYAFDSKTGSRRWVFDPEVQGVPGHAPGAYEECSDGSTIYAGSGSGHVYAMNNSDGSLQWFSAVATDGNSSVYNPVIGEDALYVIVRHFTNPISGAVVALRRNDGSQLWRHDFPSEAPTSSGPVGKVLVFEGTVIVANDDGRIYALDRNNGDVRWTAARRPEVIGLDDLRPIILVDGLVVAGSLAHFLTAYDAATGRLVWETDGGQGSAGNPLATDGGFVFEPYNSGTLGAFEAVTGKKVWLRSAPNGGLFTSYPLATSDMIFAPSTRGLVAMRK